MMKLFYSFTRVENNFLVGMYIYIGPLFDMAAVQIAYLC